MLVEDVVSMTRGGQLTVNQALGHLKAIGCTEDRAQEILGREGLLEAATDTGSFADAVALLEGDPTETEDPRFTGNTGWLIKSASNLHDRGEEVRLQGVLDRLEGLLGPDDFRAICEERRFYRGKPFIVEPPKRTKTATYQHH